MRTLRRSRIAVALAGLAFVISSHAVAQPRKRRPKPATKADIERLEKKIEVQQQTIDKLVRLQRQYAEAMSAIFDGKSAPAAPAAVTPPPPAPAVSAKPPPKKIEARPAVHKPDRMPVRPRKPEGFGTIVGKIAGARDAVVYVETISAPVRGTATMKQKGKQFVPQVLVVTKGTKVAFPNLDAIFHNVFSVTPRHSFDLGSYRQGESRSVRMSKPGVVTVYCNMHPQMVGHILVVPNSNYVRAGKDGFFRLTNVPAGKHRVVAWAPNAKPMRASAEVVDGEVVTVELTLKKRRAGMHTRKDGLPYGSYR